MSDRIKELNINIEAEHDAINATTKSSNLDLPPIAFELFEENILNKIIIPPYKEQYLFNEVDFEEIELISRAINVVTKRYHKPSGNFMAIKSIHLPYSKYNKEYNDRKSRLKREVDLHLTLRENKCDHIVKFYGICIDKSNALICLELMDMSLHDLYVKIHEKNGYFPEDLLGCIGVSIIKALIACKNEDIIHRDVKPDNILISFDGNIKLCDFGLSRILNNSLASSVVGTMLYWPPEYFIPDQTNFDIRADVWSLGVTLMEIAFGEYPFSKNMDFAAVNLQNIMHNITNQIEQFLEKLSSVSRNINEFIRSCLVVNKEKRPKYDELQNSNFYQDFFQKNEPINVAKMIEEFKDLFPMDLTKQMNFGTNSKSSNKTLNQTTSEDYEGAPKAKNSKSSALSVNISAVNDGKAFPSLSQNSITLNMPKHEASSRNENSV